MRIRLLSAVALTALVACSDSPFGVGDMLSLSEARERWQSREFQSYVFQVRSFCFCPEEYTQWHEVEVQDGAVVAVRIPGEGTSLPADRLDEWNDVDGLFDVIVRSLGGEHISKIAVRYNGALGYPEHIVIERDDNIADGGVRIEVRSMMALP